MKQITDWNTVEFNREYLVKEGENWYIARLVEIRISRTTHGEDVFYDWQEDCDYMNITPEYVFELPNTDLLTK